MSTRHVPVQIGQERRGALYRGTEFHCSQPIALNTVARRTLSTTRHHEGTGIQQRDVAPALGRIARMERS